MSQAGILSVEGSDPQIPTQFDTDSGSAIPVANILEVLGDNGITTSGSGNTVTISGVNATAAATVGAAQIGVAAFDSANFTVTAGFVSLVSGGMGIEGIVSDDGLPAIGFDGSGNVTIIGGNGIVTSGQSPSTTLTISADTDVATGYTTDSGIANPVSNNLNILGSGLVDTAGAGSTVTINVDSPVVVANGGTGATTLTDGGIILGSGTGAVTVTSQPTNGQLLIGSTGVDPVLGAITSTGSTITVSLGAGTINLETGTAVAASFPTDSGTATPSVGALTVAGGTLLGTTGSGSTVTINADDNVVGSVAGDSGTATPTSNSFTIAGSGSITTSGSGATITITDAGAQVKSITLLDNTDSPYTVLAADYYMSCDVSAGTLTIRLPDAPTTGRTFVVKDAAGNSEANNITVTTVSGVVTIDGATTYLIDTDYESADIIFNGTSYEIF